MTEAAAEATELPSSPGARLRRERELHGLSPQQAAEELNLDITVVTALEANDFAALGAPVFAKGHLRRYAAMLDLPESEILSGYEHSKVQPEQPTLIPRARVDMPPERSRPNWPWILGGASAFLLAGAIAAYVSSHGLSVPSIGDLTGRGGERSERAVEPTSEAGTQAPDAGQDAPGAAGPSGGTVQGAPAALPPVLAPPAGQVTLDLRFAADSWVEVYDGTGRAVLYDLGKGGSARRLTVTAPVSVTLGNGAAVRVAVNGRPVPPLAIPPGQTVARFSVGADGAVR